MSYLNNTLKRYCKRNSLKEKIRVILTNRGFQSVMVYRISNLLYKKKLGFISMILTRIIQILYSIDIDYKAEIDEGLVIFHGMGLVIGHGVKIGKNCTLFHNTTFGSKFSKKDVGFPEIEDDCLVGTGSILLGSVVIEKGSKVPAGTINILKYKGEGNEL